MKRIARAMASSSVTGPVIGGWSANIAVRSAWALCARSASVNGVGLIEQPDSHKAATEIAISVGRIARLERASHEAFAAGANAGVGIISATVGCSLIGLDG
ncbi:protein of unknown function [Paraburkholderia kururiensis]